MSFKLTPITAKIQKTTKGGITNPFIKGVGVPMKQPAVAKQGGRKRSKQKGIDEGKKRYNENIEQYKRDAANLKNSNVSASYKRAANKRTKNFSNELFDYDTKKNPESTKGYTPKSYLEAKANNTIKKREKPQENKIETIRDKPINRSPEIPKDTRKDTLKDTPKPTKITGKAGSDLRRKQYDAKGWAYDDTIKKPTSKATKKQKTTQSAKNNVAVNTKKKVNTKAAIEPTSKQIRKNASADRKDNRAARVRQKGIDALASGDKKKALRLKKRETRIKNRANKKRGQASKAINPN